MNAAPLIANGVLITGISGAEYGTRGFLDGWDPETGNHLWRHYTIPAPGEKGSETWPPATPTCTAAARPGSPAPTILTSTWSTGAPATPARGTRRSARATISTPRRFLRSSPRPARSPGITNSLRTTCTTTTPSGSRSLPTFPSQGQPRKVVMQFNRNGFLYVLDRTNGKLLAANAYEKVNWASGVDMKTGRPIETDVPKRLLAGEQVELWPQTRGGKNWPHAAFNPETGLLYANTMHAASLYKFVPEQPFVPGTRYQFIENKYVPVEGEPIAHMDAVDPLTAQQRWRAPLFDHPQWSAMLATGSGLLFTGKETGEFIAVDAETGKTLWQFQTGSGINAQPITFTHNGHQYVTHSVGARRHLLEPGARGAEERAAGRLGLDLRAAGAVAIVAQVSGAPPFVLFEAWVF